MTSKPTSACWSSMRRDVVDRVVEDPSVVAVLGCAPGPQAGVHTLRVRHVEERRQARQPAIGRVQAAACPEAPGRDPPPAAR